MKKLIAISLSMALLFAMTFSVSYAESSKGKYVSFGDSIAVGCLEDGKDHSVLDEYGGYASIFAEKMNLDRISYAGRGMQTQDVLYMVSKKFSDKVDAGKITYESWWADEYAYNKGISLETIRKNVAEADYISLCVGSCDFASFPGELKTRALQEFKNNPENYITELETELKSQYKTGDLSKVDYKALKKVLRTKTKEAAIYTKYASDILQGLRDYAKYYPRIVKNIRRLNPDATIILLGIYIPLSDLADLEGNKYTQIANRLLDKVNIVAKKAALCYGCAYVDCMGIEVVWHPTEAGYKQMCDRMISVLNNEKKYSGGISIKKTK